MYIYTECFAIKLSHCLFGVVVGIDLLSCKWTALRAGTPENI